MSMEKTSGANLKLDGKSCAISYRNASIMDAASSSPVPVEYQHRKNTHSPPALEREEVMRFHTQCSDCQEQAELAVATTHIPHFKEIILMSMVCEHCGLKTNETKVGGGIPDYGSRITLRVQSPEDLNREVIKSDSAGISVPEIELELAEGGLDGFYTTVEGLMVKLLENLEIANPFGSGNGGDGCALTKTKHDFYEAFLKKLKSFAEGKEFPFTVVITDPLGNSFVSPPPRSSTAFHTRVDQESSQACYDRPLDPGITVERFQRSHEQNEILGLNDLNVAP